jgi:large subunit ribosomal protein L24
MAAKIKKGDNVVVIAGAAKGTTGIVTRVFPEFDKVVVDGVNRVKRHQKPTPRNPEGGIIEKDRPIHISNVALVDASTGKPTRVRFQIEADGTKNRVAVKSGNVIESPKPGNQTDALGSANNSAD